jgi:hypothetical protein
MICSSERTSEFECFAIPPLQYFITQVAACLSNPDIHASVSRDREDGGATWQPQGLESEAYLNSTPQGSRTEDDWKDGHIHGRSSRFMNYPG